MIAYKLVTAQMRSLPQVQFPYDCHYALGISTTAPARTFGLYCYRDYRTANAIARLFKDYGYKLLQVDGYKRVERPAYSARLSCVGLIEFYERLKLGGKFLSTEVIAKEAERGVILFECVTPIKEMRVR